MHLTTLNTDSEQRDTGLFIGDSVVYTANRKVIREWGPEEIYGNPEREGLADSLVTMSGH